MTSTQVASRAQFEEWRKLFALGDNAPLIEIEQAARNTSTYLLVMSGMPSGQPQLSLLTYWRWIYGTPAQWTDGQVARWLVDWLALNPDEVRKHCYRFGEQPQNNEQWVINTLAWNYVMSAG